MGSSVIARRIAGGGPDPPSLESPVPDQRIGDRCGGRWGGGEEPGA